MTFVFIFVFLCAFCITDFMKKSEFILFNRFFVINVFLWIKRNLCWCRLYKLHGNLSTSTYFG